MAWFGFLWRKRKPTSRRGPYTIEDFPIPERVLNSDPIPDDACIIKLRCEDGRTTFTISCGEPGTRTNNLTENERLDLALAVLPEVTVVKSKPLHHIAPPGGAGDDVWFHPYSLPVSTESVLALDAALLDWSPEARSVAEGYSISADAIIKIRELMVEHFVARLRGSGGVTEPELERMVAVMRACVRQDLGLPAAET